MSLPVSKKNTLTLLEKEETIDDHCEYIRAILMAASPTLISKIDTYQLENALVFCSRGESIAEKTPYGRLYDLLNRWNMKDSLQSTISKSVSDIQSDFPQQGYIHQIFFHNMIDQISYPSIAKGVPLRHQSGYGTTTEFLSALKSGNEGERLKYEEKYHVYLNDVQLRLLADPKVFSDKDQVTLFCHHQLPIDLKKYRGHIRKKIIDPILENGFNNQGPGGLFSLSPLAKTLGSEVPRLARLADYIFTGANNPSIWIAHGNKEAVEQALKTMQLSATTTFGTEETAIELSLLAGQKEVFELLLDQLKNSKVMLTEEQGTKLFLLCFKNDWSDAAVYFLDYLKDDYYIKDVLIQASQNNSDLVPKIIDAKCKTGQVTLDGFDLDKCIKYSLKNQNFECFEWFLQEYSKIKIENSFRHKNLLSEVIKFAQPEKLEYVISLFEKCGYNVPLLEKQLIKGWNWTHTHTDFPDSYKSFYTSLSEEERSKLPLQKWWQLQFEDDE